MFMLIVMYALLYIPLSQGTLIRVYDTNKYEQLLELRRGAANAQIYW